MPCGRRAVMLAKPYGALKVAGAPDDRAREAAEQLAWYENRLAGIESDVTLIKWVLGVNVMFSLVLLVNTFFA